ncbi:bromodomain-containing protein 9-like, partial [Olea europaea var. sylvestris]|uniref:bromodomain-containing protein 9-like n=1 Tax=Olea europaea var. sylvestris TaxID=158386 RepID=UPI000C1D19CF
MAAPQTQSDDSFNFENFQKILTRPYVNSNFLASADAELNEFNLGPSFNNAETIEQVAIGQLFPCTQGPPFLNSLPLRSIREKEAPMGLPVVAESSRPDKGLAAQMKELQVRMDDCKARMTLELILDKLQKKDIYGVYAEPVDPEELPDYHDVIKHPMDFATVRNKLGNGAYETLEQFESDVFLICSNAMQYNAPDTIYHKQARTIQELAKKKIQKIRINNESSEKELKPEHDISTRSSSILKKQIKRTVSRTVQEPVGSDFSSGATLATGEDVQNVSNALHFGGSERPGSIDGLVEGNSSLNDTNLDKGEESLLGRGPLSRFGRKLAIHDENRRATYNISFAQLVASSESIFSTFEGEMKQLIPVGLYTDYSYARSLARFAATLGSVAWNVASQRIEKALPQGLKFGRGWVGEYEPLPTPVLILENCTVKEPTFFAKIEHTTDRRKVERNFKTSDS